jgi:uncharacterized membrane protein YgdD (TMEM256/DUF423 family)
MIRNILLAGAVLGFTGIILGAFGAHGLEKLASKESIESFNTGTRYQIYHALFFLTLGSLSYQQIIPPKLAQKVFFTILVGVILFSGSIYYLVFAKINDWIMLKSVIVFLTPIGGATIITGWGMFFWSIIKGKKLTKTL